MTETNSVALSCGEALVKLLEGYGVDTVFGIPGVHTLELYKGLAAGNARHVLCRHEQGAGFMADGYARATGKPGVCFIITGPGLTNIATPMGQAYSDSVPMLVITSVNETHTLGKGLGRLHETQNQRAISEPLTAFSATALSPNDIPDLLARAYSVFQSQRPRPVHIEIPLDVLAMPVTKNWQPACPVSVPQVNRQQIAAAAQLLDGAQRPVVIAGGGAIHAADEIRQLVEKLQVPLFTSVAGKGVLPNSHPLSGGATLCMEPTWQFVEQADLVLAVGTELADTDMWRDKLPITGDVIRIDIDPRKINDLYPAKLGLVGDAKHAIAALVEQCNSKIDCGAEQELQQLAADIDSAQPPLQKNHRKVLDTIRNALPADALLATDMTQIAYTGNYSFPVQQSRSWLHPTGYGTLGYGLPAAIGAKIGAPGRVVAALAGDGGILYTIQELATAVEEIHSPFIVLLWNNSALGQIRDDMQSLAIPSLGVTPKNPDFALLAQAFGCTVSQPGSLQELGDAVAEASQRNGVSFIEIGDGIC